VKKEAPVPAAKAPTGPAPDTYTVAKGDNPYNIAKKFGVSYQELLALNGITDPTKLQIGQELKVPKKAN
jgi:LysM repeat protein